MKAERGKEAGEEKFGGEEAGFEVSGKKPSP